MYADYKDQNNQTLVHILGSFLHQFLTISQQLIPDEVVQKLHDIRRQGKKVEAEGIIAMLNTRLHQFKQAFICIDAVDELEPKVRWQLLKVLKELSTENIRLFLTGRHYIENEVQKCFQVAQKYTVVLSASQQDIEAFIREQLINDPDAEDAMDEVLEIDIIDEIVRRSRGM